MILDDEVCHRQKVAHLVFSIWTSNGTNDAGLAEPLLLSNKLEALGQYVMMMDEETVDEDVGSINVVSAKDLSYSHFVENYMAPNQPVIITGLTEEWVINKEWLKFQNDKLVPDMSHLKENFGHETVSVHKQINAGFTTERPLPEDMTVSEYCEWWSSQDERESECEGESELWYLKDWKFVSAHPKTQLYEWPLWFRQDWLNEYMSDAYRFVYLGPAGTCTRLHADVLGSYSWSTNICGQKIWYLLPPQNTYLLGDCFGRLKLASNLDYKSVLYPGLSRARKLAIKIVQNAGETLFVPSGWYHTVENTQPTLSVNHNWINEYNIVHCWRKIRKELMEVLSQSVDRGASLEFIQSVNSQQKTTSQIGDDLQLLWIIVSKKAVETLESASPVNMCNNRRIFDSLLFIFKDLEEIIVQENVALTRLQLHECCGSLEEIKELIQHINEFCT